MSCDRVFPLPLRVKVPGGAAGRRSLCTRRPVGHTLKRRFHILWLWSLKQLGGCRRADLPEGVWVGGLREQQNKLQNNPLCHITQ